MLDDVSEHDSYDKPESNAMLVNQRLLINGSPVLSSKGSLNRKTSLADQVQLKLKGLPVR